MKKSPKKSHPVKWISPHFTEIIILSFLGGLVLFSPGQTIYMAEPAYGVGDTVSQDVMPSFAPAPIPYNISGIMPDSEITAGSIVVRDLQSGMYMFRKNETLRMSPASTTKLMTALVALDSYSLEDTITIRNVVSEGQVMDLFDGEILTVENLLYGALIHSANDAAFALADAYPGGRQKFVDAMNAKARELFMTDSVFSNPAGFDDPEHKMTALDLIKMATVALRNPTIAKMVAIPSIMISDTTHSYFHSLKNVNELLGKVPGVGGIKTGWTEEAGENLVTLVERNGHKVLIVVLHSQNRFTDTENLIQWVYDNHNWKDVRYTAPVDL